MAGLRVALAALALAVAGGGAAGASGAHGVRTVELTIHHSRFSTDTMHFARGATVRFVVHNTDPIDHELIIGDEAVQLRHEHGTEAHHGDRPGEVSVPAGATASTTYEFSSPGPLQFACHLPGHWAYGMHGAIVVSG